MCDIGVDQTMRFPQRWLILAPELKQKHAFTRDGREGWRFKFNDTFRADAEIFDAWSMLARPIRPRFTVHPIKQDCRMGLFNLLSNELTDMIFEYIAEDPNDTIALGLTCERFWSLVSSYIQSSYIRESAPWAATQLAFQGSWSTDLPSVLAASKAVEDIVGEDPSRTPVARKLFWASWDYYGPVTGKQKEAQWRDAIDLFREGSRIPEERWSEIERGDCCGDLYPRDRTWVLRNLTTREYVSSKPQKTGRKLRSTAKDSKALRFEDVLLMKTCWTNTAPYGWQDLRVHRGEWAGHRFDIVAEEAQLKECTDGWQDVTGEIEREWEEVRNRLESLKGHLYH